MSDATPPPTFVRRWRLGDWLIVPARNSLQPVAAAPADERTLEPRVMAVLELLLRHGTAPVSDEQLLKQVWPGIAVSDASVYQAIAQLRKALGDSSKPYRYVGRVSGKGYYLIQAAVPIAEAETEPQAELISPGDHAAAIPTANHATRFAPIRRQRLALIGALGIGAVTALGWWWLGRQPAAPAALTTVASAPITPVNQTDRDQHPDSPGWDEYLQGRWLWTQRKVGLLEQAAEHFRAAINKDPELALAYVGLCDVYHFQHLYGDWPLQKVLAQCEPLLRSALQRQPNLGAALASFGLLRLSQGDLDAAETYLDRASSQNPGDAMTMMWRGELQRLRGNTEQALRTMQQAEALDPLSAVIKRNLYYTLASMGQLLPAQEALDEALLLDPDYVDRPVDEIEVRPLTVAGAVAFIQWAQRFPDRTSTSNPTRGIGVQTNLAVVYLALRDFAAADAALKQAEAASPTHPYVQLVRASWWRAKGDKQQALALLQQRAAAHPNNTGFAQVALLQQAELDGNDAVRQQFEQRFPGYRAAITPPLNADDPRLLLMWLALATTEQRQALTAAVNDMLQQHAVPERMALSFRLLVDPPAAAAQLQTLLAAGALISPADDYLLPEDNPLWRTMPSTLLQALQHNREQVRARLRR